MLHILCLLYFILCIVFVTMHYIRSNLYIVFILNLTLKLVVGRPTDRAAILAENWAWLATVAAETSIHSYKKVWLKQPSWHGTTRPATKMHYQLATNWNNQKQKWVEVLFGIILVALKKAGWVGGFEAASLSSFAADAAGQLDILGHDGHPLYVDGADGGVLEQPRSPASVVWNKSINKLWK